MDVTMQIIEAQDARARMQDAKKRIKSEVRRKYEARMAQEIAEASQDAEIEFARTLARVHAAGVSQALLRREVLRTNVWSVWTYWRDLANIEPERISTAAAKAASAKSKAGYRWEICTDNPVGYALVLTRNQKGEEVDEVRFTDIEPNSEGLITVYPQMQVFPEHRTLGEQFNGAEKMYQFATKVARENEGDIRD